jgi:hypothetical protein
MSYEEEEVLSVLSVPVCVPCVYVSCMYITYAYSVPVCVHVCIYDVCALHMHTCKVYTYMKYEEEDTCHMRRRKYCVMCITYAYL